MTRPEDEGITLEQLPAGQRELAELLGMSMYVELTRRFGGDTIYIQKYSELQKSPRNAEIRRKFDGYNFSELAREYDLSERYVRALVQDITDPVRRRPLEGRSGLTICRCNELRGAADALPLDRPGDGTDTGEHRGRA